MLTYPSDPIPQIVCPMDEDAIPPNRFCSAPPHSEPTPPLLPLPSITPSCANDETSGHRRSGRIQGIRAQTPKKQSNTDSGAAHKPSRQNPSPSKRQRESGKMVQVSQSKQLRVESTHEHEKQNEDGLDFSFAAERQNEQNDQKSPQKKTNVSAAENIVEQFSDNTKQNLDINKSDMVSCGGLAVGHTVENASAPRGWVIGPLFQSFKSKMASFTEIVMSPVKLFKANSPSPSMDHQDALNEGELQPDGKADAEPPEPSDKFHPEVQSENRNQDAKANQQRLSEEESVQNAKTVAIKCSKVLSFDVELSAESSEQADECATTQKEDDIPDSVPLQHSPLPCIVSEDFSVGPVFRSSILLEPSVDVSASHRSNLSSADEEQKGKLPVQLNPLPRKCTGSRKRVTSKMLTSEIKEVESDPDVTGEQVSCINSVKSNKADSSDSPQMLSLSSSVCYAQPDTNCPQPDGDEGRKIEGSQLVRQSLRSNKNIGANGRTLKPALDIQQLNPETRSAAGLGRAKREPSQACRSQDVVKRKRLTAAVCTENTNKQDLVNVASDSGILRELRPPRKEIVSTNTIINGKETLEPASKRQAVSTRANRKGKDKQEMLAVINEVVLNPQTESSSEVMLVSSSDESRGLSGNNCKSSSKMRPVGSCKRLKARPDLDKPDVNVDNSMDLETTIAITSSKQAEQEQLSEILVRPDIKQLQSSKKSRNINKKQLKRKSPNQANSTTESESTVVSTSSARSAEPFEVTSSDFNTSQHVQNEERSKMGLNQPSKRPRKGHKGAVKPSSSSGGQETMQCIDNLSLINKENESQEGKGKMSMDPVYFEMTPTESNGQPGPSALQLNADCYVQLNNDVKTLMDGKEKDGVVVTDEVLSSDAEATNHRGINVSGPKSGTRWVNIKPRRADKQRRKCRIFHSRTRKSEEFTNSITMDDVDLATAAKRSSENGLSRPLLRSYSCPEIHSLRPFDMPWTPSLHSPHHSRIHTSHQHQASHAPLVHHVHKSLRRARRHTVCSVEVEREIAPLCLRKEVYPSRRSLPYDGFTQSVSPSHALSPSTSLSALATFFLSSPLAFLSKKVDSRGAAANPSTSNHVFSPTFSSLHPLSPNSWHPGFLQRTDPCSAALDCSSSGLPFKCEIDRRQQSEMEYYGEETSTSSQEFEDIGLREEKALSDSEIKVVQKHERGKVSSIRIRKTLPKPQNNLTPMGLPKPIRLKKKEFSLEEIYTNKNFSKPPESRLETIFEVPLNRRNGSESWFGQRRVKRFLEFLDVGEARKPKKQLAGVVKTGTSSSRTRRGASPKDEPSLGAQDVDSLLCAKLDQLNLWLMHDQTDS